MTWTALPRGDVLLRGNLTESFPLECDNLDICPPLC